MFLREKVTLADARTSRSFTAMVLSGAIGHLLLPKKQKNDILKALRYKPRDSGIVMALVEWFGVGKSTGLRLFYISSALNGTARSDVT
jgi:hypothetical protein